MAEEAREPSASPSAGGDDEGAPKKRRRRRRRRRKKRSPEEGGGGEGPSSGGEGGGESGGEGGEGGEPKKKRRRRRRRRRKKRAEGEQEAGEQAEAGEDGESEGSAGASEGEEGEPKPKKRRRRRRRRSKKPPLGPPAEGEPATLKDARALARERFGINRLRPEQSRALEGVLAGKDALVVLPTGYGKSLVYQLAAYLRPTPTLVISPLIALMQDQQKKLQEKGLPVVRLDSTLLVGERRDALAKIREGKPLIVLTTPETLQREETQEVLREAGANLLCVDEAHCISEWGHDFRPAYLRLIETRKELGLTQVIALTATAPPQVQEDISIRLNLEDPIVVVAPPHRKNLRLGCEIVHGDVKFDVMAKLLKRLKPPGIVYCSTTRAVDQIGNALKRAQLRAELYHGKLPKKERMAAQKRFMKSKGRKSKIMVATSAFGMGIDKSDIRYIIHYQSPASLEQYVQEAGRAGRDGKQSRCILLFDPKDLEIHERLQASSRPSPAQLRRVAEALAEWTEPVGVKALALSAQAPMSATGVICSELTAAGLVERDGKRRYSPATDKAMLVAGAAALSVSYATQAEEDDKRLKALLHYAESEECRSSFIRRWFGEEDPPACGKCDRCREAKA